MENEGNTLGRPAVGYLEDGIYELRIIVERDQHRILFFFEGDIIVATHAFLKKTKKVPAEEIKRALKIRADWTTREGKTRYEDQGSQWSSAE
ncbi:MAG: type II toxin-antitoxin system RelE/ParE family toxin [Elusimicrobiota bacterium]|nr:MAG: type II toxin-antitoxin system RelE/ParE family toxin [Elusimicrobiota bacterium]